MATLKRQRLDRLRFETAASARPQIPGAVPATTRQILDREAGRPLRGGGRDFTEDSLWGIGREQQELF